MVHRIRRSVLLAITILIALSLSATIVAVLRTASNDIEARNRQELEVAARVFDRRLADRGEQLGSHASLLARDFRFKQAIAKHAISRNDQDMIDLLLEHEQSIGADLSLLVDARGRITSNTPTDAVPASTLERLRSHEVNRLNAVTVVGDKPYQLVFAPVKASNWIAWVGMGFEIQPASMRNLKQITGMEGSLLFQRKDGPIKLISTLPESLSDLLASNGSHMRAATASFTRALEEQNWLSINYPLVETPDATLVLVLSTSIARDMAAYQSLRKQLLTLGLLIFFLATAVAIWFSGRAQHSVRSLALAAQRIAHGDYSTHIALADNRELAGLEQAFNTMQEAIEEREQRIHFQAQHDALTGLPNRHSFEAWFKTVLADSEEPGPFALVIMQICGFSQLTDIYGPEISNQLVKSAAGRARSLLGPRDKIARFESDEFFIYREGITEAELASLSTEMMEAFRRPFVLGDIDIKLEIRMGAALCPDHGTAYSDLLRRANIALSQTFVRKTFFEVYESGQDATHLRRIQIIHCLQDVVGAEEFQLLFQPQYSLTRQAITRAEILLRWHNDNLGAVSPEEFIPLAERSGHIIEITGWLLHRALDQLVSWREQGINVGLGINVSAQDLLKESFAEQLIEGITERQIDKSCLVVEVTESAMIEHPDQVISNLGRLYDFGIGIAMDDFGTGFSSLSQLKSLPIHELKIDKSFILNLDQDRDDQKIVHAAIEMAHSLDLQVVAEGVESLSTLTILESMGCDIIQGNYLGKPMSASNFETWLKEMDPQSLAIGEHSRPRLD